jgi:hypothetical protein
VEGATFLILSHWKQKDDLKFGRNFLVEKFWGGRKFSGRPAYLFWDIFSKTFGIRLKSLIRVSRIEPL